MSISAVISVALSSSGRGGLAGFCSAITGFGTLAGFGLAASTAMPVPAITFVHRPWAECTVGFTSRGGTSAHVYENNPLSATHRRFGNGALTARNMMLLGRIFEIFSCVSQLF